MVLNRCEGLFTHAQYLEDRLAELGHGQPMASHPLPLTNVTRPDEVGTCLSPEDALAMAPAAEDGRFRVPRILDEEV